jgi:hypothetical protein
MSGAFFTRGVTIKKIFFSSRFMFGKNSKKISLGRVLFIFQENALNILLARVIVTQILSRRDESDY